MKLIAFSDSHGDHMPMLAALKKHPKTEVVIFCGDGHHDIREVQKACEEAGMQVYFDRPLRDARTA